MTGDHAHSGWSRDASAVRGVAGRLRYPLPMSVFQQLRKADLLRRAAALAAMLVGGIAAAQSGRLVVFESFMRPT